MIKKRKMKGIKKVQQQRNRNGRKVAGNIEVHCTPIGNQFPLIPGDGAGKQLRWKNAFAIRLMTLQDAQDAGVHTRSTMCFNHHWRECDALAFAQPRKINVYANEKCSKLKRSRCAIGFRGEMYFIG